MKQADSIESTNCIESKQLGLHATPILHRIMQDRNLCAQPRRRAAYPQSTHRTKITKRPHAGKTLHTGGELRPSATPLWPSAMLFSSSSAKPSCQSMGRGGAASIAALPARVRRGERSRWTPGQSRAVKSRKVRESSSLLSKHL